MTYIRDLAQRQRRRHVEIRNLVPTLFGLLCDDSKPFLLQHNIAKLSRNSFTSSNRVRVQKERKESSLSCARVLVIISRYFNFAEDIKEMHLNF